MREIKFAWVCKNIHLGTIERVELTDMMLLDGSMPSWITSDNCEVIAKILPTGLKDKSGKEIWEGDVVEYLKEWGQYKGIPQRRVVKYNDGWGVWEPLCWEMDERPCPMTFKIIGNIYENPELIKGDN